MRETCGNPQLPKVFSGEIVSHPLPEGWGGLFSRQAGAAWFVGSFVSSLFFCVDFLDLKTARAEEMEIQVQSMKTVENPSVVLGVVIEVILRLERGRESSSFGNILSIGYLCLG